MPLIMAESVTFSQTTSQSSPATTDAALNCIGEAATQLLRVVFNSLLKVVNNLETLKKIIAESVDATSPEISMRLNELRTFLGDVVLKGRSYCNSCKDLGDYASDEEIIAIISADLENGKLAELKDFLTEIEEYLEVCETRFQRVKHAKETAKNETKAAGEKMEKLKESKSKKCHMEQFASATLAVIGGGTVCASVVLSVLCPPAGIAAIIAGITSSACTVGLLLDAGYTKKQADILVDSCKVIIALDKNLTIVGSTISSMRTHITDIQESRILGKLKDQAAREGSTVTGTVIRKLKWNLKNLQRQMSVLKEESVKCITDINNVKV